MLVGAVVCGAPRPARLLALARLTHEHLVRLEIRVRVRVRVRVRYPEPQP